MYVSIMRRSEAIEVMYSVQEDATQLCRAIIDT